MNALNCVTDKNTLTARQMEVLRLYVQDGKTIKQVSAELRISSWTVRNHLYRVRDYVGAVSLPQMAFRAREIGLIKGDGEDGRNSQF